MNMDNINTICDILKEFNSACPNEDDSNTDMVVKTSAFKRYLIKQLNQAIDEDIDMNDLNESGRKVTKEISNIRYHYNCGNYTQPEILELNEMLKMIHNALHNVNKLKR